MNISKEKLNSDTESSQIFFSLLISFLNNFIGLNILHKKGDSYFITNDAINGFIRLFNLKKIKDYKINHYEKELNSHEAIFSYYENKLSKYYETLCYLGNAYLKRLEYWNKFDPHPLLFIKIHFCFEELCKQKVSFDKSSYVNDQYNTLEKGIEQYKSLKSHKDYKKIAQYYRKCFKLKCRTCGGNVINYVKLFGEKIRREILEEEIIKEILVKIKSLIFISNEVGLQSFSEFIREGNKTLGKKYNYKGKVFKNKNAENNAIIRNVIFLRFIEDFKELSLILIFIRSKTLKLLEKKSQTNKHKILENIKLFKENHLEKFHDKLKYRSFLHNPLIYGIEI